MKRQLFTILALLSCCASAEQVSVNIRKVTSDDVRKLYDKKAYGPAREVAIQCANESSDVNCQLQAGEFLLAGVGGPEDAPGAFVFVKASAQQGSPAAHALLGNLYFLGRGVPQDRAESLKWWERSATNCNTWAQNAVARTYFEGEYVPKDLVSALHWVSIAAHFKFAGAQDGIDLIRPLLNKEQLAQAEKRSALFIRQSGCGTAKPVVLHEP